MKKILIAILMVASLIPGRALAAAMSPSEAFPKEMVDDDIQIVVGKQVVRVTGAQGKTLEVISLTGRHVLEVRIDSPSQKIELNIPKGCYIIRIGQVVRKIVV